MPSLRPFRAGSLRATGLSFRDLIRLRLRRQALPRTSRRRATVSLTMTFDSLGLPEPLVRAVADAGYAAPTDVQSAAIPPALAGTDLMVAAATGSGKTASFILPALNRVLAARADTTKRRDKGTVYGPRILVLTPTRELAMQIAKAAATYGRHVPGLRVATVVGGVPYPAQLKALRGPLDILISTPGRLLDHLQTGKAVLENVEMLVLDEADRMLDMGFIDDITTIADHVPSARQTVMYSATFVGNVARLAQNLLRDPQRVDVASHTDTHANIEQRLHWADNFAAQERAARPHPDRSARSSRRSSSRARRSMPTGSPIAWPSSATPSRRCTAACRRAGATASCRACARASCASWSRPTSPRAASTCRRSATSSTTACR